MRMIPLGRPNDDVDGCLLLAARLSKGVEVTATPPLILFVALVIRTALS